MSENLELRSDTEVQKALQVRQGLGTAFAWLYVVDRVLPVLASLYQFCLLYCNNQYSYDVKEAAFKSFY